MAFLVYKSSAGSGKTYNLVKEYLKIILKNPSDFRKILAITFTNKAASEMKTRIIDILLNIINIENLPEKEKVALNLLIDEIAQLLQKDQIFIRTNAKKSLELILYNYSDFAVSTIDSFVHGIVRTFAKDLNLPVNFDIELNQDVFLTQAVDVLISKVGTDDDITQLLLRFIENQIDNQNSLNIENEIKNTASYLFKEDSIKRVESIKNLKINDFFKFQSELFSFIMKYKASLVSIAKKANDLIKKTRVSAEAFYYKKNGIASYFQNIVLGKIDGINNKNIAKGVENNKWTSDLCTPEEARIINSIKLEIENYYYQIKTIADRDGQKANLYFLIARNIFSLAVLTEIAEIIENIKLENNVLHISEFNKKIADIVLNEPVPFIYERTGAKFSHIMIDEFQDTSVLQWLNLLPLVENALAEGGNALIVGDAKQAIYRWRDGDAEQFTNLPSIKQAAISQDFAQKEKTLKNNSHIIELNTNYRSHKQIVDFNNDFFIKMCDELPEIYKDIFKNASQNNPENKKGGYVQFDFFKKDADSNFEEFNLKKTKSIIDDLIENRKYNLSDIAILCRSNKNANAIAKYLIKNDIQVLSSESLLLSKSPVVKFLIAFLKYLQNNEDTIAAACAMHFLYIRGESVEKPLHTELLELANNKKTFQSFIERHYKDVNFYMLKNLSLYDLCEEIVRIFLLNETSDAYLNFFLDVVYEYAIKNKNNINDFLSYWEDNQKNFSVVVPQGMNAVKIMTIHKSKGLQFPVVIFPFANDKKKLNKDNLWIDLDDELFNGLSTTLIPANENVANTVYASLYEEEDNKSKLDLINLLYVAMTRPVEKLFIISETPGKTSKTISQNLLFRKYLQAIACWDENKNTYFFGENENSMKSEERNTIDNLTLKNYISKRWQNALVMKYKSKNVWQSEETSDAVIRGKLIHLAMGKIRTSGDVEPVIKTLYKSNLLSVEELNVVKEKILKILSHSLISEFYSEQCNIMNEREIMDINGDLFRPDRIAVINGKVAVIDYKTGEQDEKYKIQLDNYARLLDEIGYENIVKFIVYIDKETIINWV